MVQLKQESVNFQCNINLRSYPAVRGYLLEEAFFTSKEDKFEVMMADARLKTDTVLTSMEIGVLYSQFLIK